MDEDTTDFNEGAAGGELAWRETYVVLFEHANRPTLTQVEAAIGAADNRLKMEKLSADEDGYFRSLLVQAPEDNAMLDIRYESGDAISERAMTLATQLQDELQGDQMGRLVQANAWLEVMHFERLGGGDEWSEEPDEMAGPEGLDPATLITVIGALAELTDGLPIDPEAGEILT
ncbi:hypothetical protein MalM25_24990 [Planctomycetes bacterium MalM25]|nr:hypothetical protein MalM25_24990 [Planctomycetes bacterium MalM25]